MRDRLREDSYYRWHDEKAAEEQAHLDLCADLRAQGVERWWPHRVPGMSAHVWLEHLGQAAAHHELRKGSWVSREMDVESGRRRMR